MGGAVGALAIGSFGPVVRLEATRVAERYGGTVAIERVVPTWSGVRLYGVDVALDDVPSTVIHLEEVEVRVGPGGRAVELHGGTVTARGSSSLVLHEFGVWRSHHESSAGFTGGHGGVGGTTISVAGVIFAWKNDALTPTETLNASNVSVTREEDRLTVTAETASVVLGRAKVEVKQPRVRLSRGTGAEYRIGELAAENLEAEIAAAADKGRGSIAASESSNSAGKQSIHAELVSAARRLDAILAPDARVHLAGVHAHVSHGADATTLGPGQLEIARSNGSLVIDLAPQLKGASATKAAAGAAGQALTDREEALTFRLSIPLADTSDAPQEIIADIQGGPIWLSSLGLKEGDRGLFDVGHASVLTRSHLILAPDGESLRIDGEGKIHGLSLRSDALSDEPVAGLELAFRAKGDARLDGTRIHLEGGEVDLGAIRVLLQGDYERVKDSFRVRGSFDVPLTACQSMLDAVPKGLVPKLQGMRIAGSFGLRGKASFDTALLDRSFNVNWDTSNTCRVIEAPLEINVERFQKPFRRTVYDGEGRLVTMDSGPGAPGWTPIAAISKFMEVAVLTTEDGGFRRHHGFDYEAIKNSIRENLRKRRFVRGASTISMQLAKNLYLDRGKHLSRKLQEAVLTMYLEQALTKEQLLELYLNVVEFGPMVYGIGPAARYYFNATPGELSLSQALYISSIMPNPKNQYFGAGGVVAAGWMNYLRKLMKIAHDRHNITDEELEDGLHETVVRGSPTPQRDAHPTGISAEPDGPESPEGAGDWLGP